MTPKRLPGRRNLLPQALLAAVLATLAGVGLAQAENIRTTGVSPNLSNVPEPAGRISLGAGAGSGVNLKSDYGAKGDAVTDDAAVIHAAFTAVPVGGQKIVFPCGNYPLGSAITGNGNPVDIVFEGAGCVVFAVNHTGTAITLPQSNLANKVTITGNAMFVAGASSASAGVLNVSFPATASWGRPTFDMKGVISCVSTAANVTTPYPQTFTNCLTLTGSWYGEARIWYSGAAVASTIPVAGTSAITLGDGTMALRVVDLFSIWADQAVWLKGYTEGLAIDDATDAGSNFGLVRVGAITIDATGATVGSSGITPRTGINANAITIKETLK